MPAFLKTPVRLIFIMMKILGGFPFSFKKTNSESRGRNSPDQMEIVSCNWSKIWSCILLGLVVISGIFCLFTNVFTVDHHMHIKDSDNITNILTHFISKVAALAAIIMQVQIFRFSKQIAHVIRQMEKILREDAAISLWHNFVLYLAFFIDFILVFILLMSSTMYGMNVYMIATAISCVVYIPLSSFATFGTVYPISNMLATELDTNLESYISKNLPPNSERKQNKGAMISPNTTVDKMLPSTNGIHNVSLVLPVDNERKLVGIRHINGDDKETWNTEYRESPSEFVQNMDDITDTLMEYQPVLILTAVFEYLSAMVVTLYMSLMIGGSLSFMVLPLTMILKSFLILYTPEPLVKAKQNWLRKLRRIVHIHSHNIDKAEIEKLICLLETGTSFKPWGLFTMGRGCFLPVLSSILTYWIIAVQFKMAEPGDNQCDNVTITTQSYAMQ